jgi:hypothetical protein
MRMRDYNNNNESLIMSKVYNNTATFFVIVPEQTRTIKMISVQARNNRLSLNDKDDCFTYELLTVL